MEQSQQKLNQTKATANKTTCTIDLVSVIQEEHNLGEQILSKLSVFF